MGLWERIHGSEALTGAEAGPTIAEAVADAGVTSGPAREIWGRPGRCPECGGRGYLDRIDVIDHIQYEHCTECFHKWSVRQSETVPAG